MATGQVALTRHRMPGPVQRASRQAVPAFLQKLHEMLNEPQNTELIRWSDAGDSFFVLDHERFAREVLGRWFKHQNFASFVRQLNMYGFHKIPHLQQGVLKSDADTEHWNFAHPNFHRGQPDLLCLIQRKKQPTHPGDDVAMDFRESVVAPPTGPLQSSGQGQMIDAHTILTGITAIKRHQASISQELNELKQSNQMLWQDALEARKKHQKQQDTINRIVKFLAGVFGNHTSPDKDDVVENPSRAMVPRRKSRFLIEDGRSGKVAINGERSVSESSFDTMGQSYPIIETPASIPSPSPSDSESLLGQSKNTLPRDKSKPPETPTSTTQTQNSNTFQQQDAIERSVTPTRSAGGIDMDRFQMVLNHLTPSQIQQLLSSIPNLDQMASNDTSDRTSSSQVTQYTPPSDLFNQFINPISNPQPMSVNASPTEGLLSFEDPQNHTQELNLSNDDLINAGKQWTAIEDIERDVNASNTDIESLIRGLGLSLDNQSVNETGSAKSSPSTSSLHLEPDDAHPDPPIPLAPPGSINAPTNAQNTQNEKSLLDTPSLTGFDFESFINSFDSNLAPLDAPFSADETFNQLEQASVPRDPTNHLSPAPPLPGQQPISPYQQGAPIPGLRIVSGTTKRKSDASDLLIPPPTLVDGLEDASINLTPPPVKPTKRRRNK